MTLEQIARHVDDWTLEAGASLTRQGSAGHEAFVIIEGQATVRVGGAPVAVLGPGEIVGEMSMLDHQPRSASVQADTPMRVLVIGPESFDEFASLRPVARQLTKELAERLRRADNAVVAVDATG